MSALPMFGQFNVAGHPIQIHGFFSQGFAYSDANNYLTMQTSKGSFAMTDGGINISTNFTDKLHLGAQVYERNLGALGRGQVTLDWALVDYRFNDHIGVRAGQVKTGFGLLGETQDVESLQTWALLPQSIYPLDARTTRVAHIGADVYGGASLGRLGDLHYDAYTGRLPQNLKDGFQYGLRSAGIKVRAYNAPLIGATAQVQTRIPGLLVGTSAMRVDGRMQGTIGSFGEADDHTRLSYLANIFFAEYSRGNFRLDAELQRETADFKLFVNAGVPILVERSVTHPQSWYTSGSYRVNKYLELGTYHSRFYPNPVSQSSNQPDADRRIIDQTVTARLDLNRYVDFKIEGHFIDGHGSASTLRGFYYVNNPQGLKPRTDLLVLRLGVSF